MTSAHSTHHNHSAHNSVRNSVGNSTHRMELKARAPAKLILSGEHAVVYGYPALAVAVNRFAESTVRSHAHFSPSIFFNFLNLEYAKTFSFKALLALKHELQQQYHAFLEGRCSIREVLKRPFELLQYTVTDFLEHWNIHLPEGVEIQTTSEIPMGCGMGSSAATVISTLYALAKFFNLEIDPAKFLNLGLTSENLQHGRSSGVDLLLSQRGGCFKFQSGNAEEKPIPKIPLQIVHTGIPLSSTGQCVLHVTPHFEKHKMGEDFNAVTLALENALAKDDLSAIKQCVRENHKLLVKIGVVPPKVQTFIDEIESRGGAAKICGAGAVLGENAGTVWTIDCEAQLAANFGYEVDQVECEEKGVRLIGTQH